MSKYFNYHTIERGIAIGLTCGMVIVVLLATISFLQAILAASTAFNADIQYPTFQVLFDRILAAIIALELAHSVQQMAAGKRSIIQVRTVIIIGVLAVVRKLILLEIDSTSGAYLAGLAAVILALGTVYFLIQWVEDRGTLPQPKAPGEQS